MILQALTNFRQLFALLLLAPLCACAATPEKPAPYTAAESYQQLFQSMDDARQQALAQDKLVMYVMGANWCHDSVAFVDKTRSPEFAALIDQRYVVQLLDVGYLEYIREVIGRYDQPVIYGTPTVLVVEPRSNTLLNTDTLPYWRNAEAISLADTLAYFEAFAPGQVPASPAPVSEDLARALGDIDAFEQRQAERIYRAYDQLGAAIRAGGEGPPSADFMADWKNLAAMRSRITEDLDRLRASARQQFADGIDPISLDYPHYELFIDDPA